MHVLDIKNFTPSANNNIGTGAKFSHKVWRGTLSDSQKTWICKEIESPDLAKIELLAQEFFRLMIPYQPETRIAHNPRFGTYYILSEEVAGYRDLPLNEAQNFSNGTYTGLGQVVTCSMFLQEIDLKNGNLGLDKHNRVTKIDGDWCFAEERWEARWIGRYKITPNAISKLPYPQDYPAYNWLDLTIQSVKQSTSKIIAPELVNDLSFRSEVNQCMLNICLLPDGFIDYFVDAYMPVGGQRFVDLLKARRDELRFSALQNQSFKTYLTTPQAELDAVSFFKNLSSFRYEGQPIVPPEHQPTVKHQFDALTTNLNLPLVQLTAEPTSSFDNIGEDLDDLEKELEQLNLVVDTTSLLEKIKQEVNPNDKLLAAFIAKSTVDINNNQNNPELLQKINNDLCHILTSLQSPEVKAIKDTIASFRNRAGFFTIGMREKAAKIEQAFYETPLEKRGTIISSKETNDVQKNLAQHRHFWRRSAVDASNNINPKQAAQTFKDLKAKVKQLSDSNDEVTDIVAPKTY